MPSRYPKVSIIGAGVVGSSISIALFEKGYQFASVIDRVGSSAVDLARHVKCKRASTQITDVAPNSDIVIITVSDGAIEEVADQFSKIKKINFKKITTLHCSGVYSSEIMNSIKRKGGSIGSMHPIQTFPTSQRSRKLVSKLKGIYYGIDGNPEAIQVIEKIVEDLSGKSITITKEFKPLYHIACVFASNYMAVLLNAICELSRILKLKASWQEIFGPLMTATMENIVRETASSALTGPIVRGDISTVEVHLKTLLDYAPQYLPFYTVGGIEVARVAKDNGKITQDDFDEIVAKFRKFIQTNSVKKITKVKH